MSHIDNIEKLSKTILDLIDARRMSKEDGDIGLNKPLWKSLKGVAVLLEKEVDSELECRKPPVSAVVVNGNH